MSIAKQTRGSISSYKKKKHQEECVSTKSFLVLQPFLFVLIDIQLLVQQLRKKETKNCRIVLRTTKKNASH
jgi:hypothetical protein